VLSTTGGSAIVPELTEIEPPKHGAGVAPHVPVVLK
jgi:hypothetical protein